MTLSTSPLHEEIAVWRHTTQGTVEDFAELDRILARHRNPDTALAHILARVAEPDVPIHVAADIDQFVWEQDYLIAKVGYAVATDHEEGWVPDGARSFDTAEEARATLAPWMHAHVVRRVIVEVRIPDEPAHGESAQVHASA